LDLKIQIPQLVYTIDQSFPSFFIQHTKSWQKFPVCHILILKLCSGGNMAKPNRAAEQTNALNILRQ
jgi:hypothetical protein